MAGKTTTESAGDDFFISKIPPQNVEAEQALLGSLLMAQKRKDEILEACEKLRPEHFYREANGRIYEAALTLLRGGIEVDVVTLKSELEKRQTLEHSGGVLYLMQLAEFVPTAANLKHYRDLVLEDARLRRLIEIANEVAGMAYARGESQEILGQLETVVRDIREGTASGRGDVRILRDVIAEEMDRIDKRYHDKLNGVPDLGIMTEIEELDELLTGMKDGEVHVLAARPAQGKSALAMTVARAGARQGSVFFASLEMSEGQLGQRILAGEARLDSYALRVGALEQSDWEELGKAMESLWDVPIYLATCSGLKPSMLTSRAKRIKGLRLVVVDYFQLMQGDAPNGDRRVMLEEISRALKAMALELNVPVLVLCQLSREVEKRADKRPMLSDLREAAIENEADAVWGLYRPSYYAKEPIDTNKPDKVEIIILKNRMGPVGTANSGFIAAQTRFETWVETPDFPTTEGYAHGDVPHWAQ